MINRFIILLVVLLVSCEEIFEVDDLSMSQVSITAPKEGAVINDSIVNLSWEELAGSERYLIQVARPNFEDASQLVLDTILVLDSTYVGSKIRVKLNKSPYEWRIKASNSAFESQYNLANFTVE
ncbi:hypothetical protein [Croceivirga radicis]|uniref:hypothetical protein n=1 Tax=Croceivirga radicis TaxID=1929488 RepID=UPI000255B221|nr:hypothetical protein [Croceivirga radicis]